MNDACAAAFLYCWENVYGVYEGLSGVSSSPSQTSNLGNLFVELDMF